MDQGTAWEIGYGIAKGLPVYAWSTDPDDLLNGLNVKVGSAPAGPLTKMAGRSRTLV